MAKEFTIEMVNQIKTIVFEGLEEWLKERRDEQQKPVVADDPNDWETIDNLLNEVRECGAMGFLPWSDDNRAYRERDN